MSFKPISTDTIGLNNSDFVLRIVSVPLAGAILGIVVTLFLTFKRVMNQDRGTEEMIKIADAIKLGARAFLKQEYTWLALFVIVMFCVVGGATSDWGKTAVAFLVGAFLSALCGYLGMSIAVEANVRTANAAKNSLNDALSVAFASGGVMGLSVVSSGLLGLIIIWGSYQGIDQQATNYLAGFGFGASAIALFARVGGGIYTKAADVGADLVGKVEAGIPEDDPKNPATIADNVGDNVGDVAGMGADLFESFVGSIIACIQLSETATRKFNGDLFGQKCALAKDLCQKVTEQDIRSFILIPFWVAGFGMICSQIGIFLVRTNQNTEDAGDDLQDLLLNIIRRAIYFASLLAWVMAIVTCGLTFGWQTNVCWRLIGCITIGLAAGNAIGYFTEYATSFAYKPTKSIAKKSRVGSAGVIIQGLGIGMLSTVAPVVIIFISILACTVLAGEYGIGIAAVGMLSTLGVTLATDAFGPVADNAGGIAEMAELPEAVRNTTDGLDALGNTTAATGKGFAIGSAVLTALALLAAFKSNAKLNTGIDVSDATVLSGAIFGACLPYVFAALTMMAVGRAASMMIEEVRRQFRELGLLEENPKGPPEYQKCVEISTRASVIEMIIPGLLAVFAPLFLGFLLNAEALGGMLVGSITSGFMLAVFMANAGGAWDNAKKWIEAEGLGPNKGKGSEYHKAAVVGDTIGDPFKDTSGPALNILIKLMTMISLVFADRFNSKVYRWWWIALILGVVFLAIAIGLTLWMRAQGMGKIKYDQGATPQTSAPDGAATVQMSDNVNGAVITSDVYDDEAGDRDGLLGTSV